MAAHLSTVALSVLKKINPPLSSVCVPGVHAAYERSTNYPESFVFWTKNPERDKISGINRDVDKKSGRGQNIRNLTEMWTKNPEMWTKYPESTKRTKYPESTWTKNPELLRTKYPESIILNFKKRLIKNVLLLQVSANQLCS